MIKLVLPLYGIFENNEVKELFKAAIFAIW